MLGDYPIMISRGWADGKDDYHAVQVAMSRLARDKKIARPAYGEYVLASSFDLRLDTGNEEPATMGVQSP